MDVINPDLRFSRASNQLSCELDGEIAILNLDTSLYFGLTEVAALLWRELETPRSLEELTAAVLNLYDVESQQCRKDVAQFLSVLRDRKLLKAEDAIV